MRVMDSAGQVADSDVVKALNWLADNADDVHVDIVLMAFGRQADPVMTTWITSGRPFRGGSAGCGSSPRPATTAPTAPCTRRRFAAER